MIVRIERLGSAVVDPELNDVAVVAAKLARRSAREGRAVGADVEDVDLAVPATFFNDRGYGRWEGLCVVYAVYPSLHLQTVAALLSALKVVPV